MVIEDRDFRTPAEAQSDCRKAKSDRSGRDVKVLSWRTWERNEIENYFLDPEILYPAMAYAYEDANWRSEWSGKDVLQWLRISLSARYGWRDRTSGQRVNLRWQGLNRAKQDAQDRPIEVAIKPVLVEKLLAHLQGLTTGELHDEWSAILADIRSHINAAGSMGGG